MLRKLLMIAAMTAGLTFVTSPDSAQARHWCGRGYYGGYYGGGIGYTGYRGFGYGYPGYSTGYRAYYPGSFASYGYGAWSPRYYGWGGYGYGYPGAYRGFGYYW